eukprot:Opistho-2@26428
MRLSNVATACWLLLLILSPIALMGTLVRAQDDDGEDATVEAAVEDVPASEETAGEEGEEKDGTIAALEDVDATILFYSHTEKSFPAGDVVRAAIGFSNKGEKDLLVTKIDGSFRYPQDFNYIIQNFTSLDVGEIVRPNTEASFSYYFRPDPNFDARPFGLIVTVDYIDSQGTSYRSTLFNETIAVTELVEGFDTLTFQLYVTLAGLALLGAFFIQRALGSAIGKSSRKTRAARVETGTRSTATAADNEWLEGLVDQKPQRSPKSKKIR